MGATFGRRAGAFGGADRTGPGASAGTGGAADDVHPHSALHCIDQVVSGAGDRLPLLEREKFWVGVCLHKNSLGRLCLVCGAVTIWSLIKRRRRNEPELCRYQNYIEFGFLAIIALMLKGPETNYPVTSIATLALATMALLGLILLRRSLADRLFASLSVFTILLAVMLMLVSVTGYIPTFGMAKLGRDATFTGRTDIWNGVREVAGRAL